MAPAVRERIALTVADANGCGYCLAAHGYVARNVLRLPDEEIHLARRASFSDARLDAALKFASAVLERRGGVSDDDLERIWSAGFSDAETLEIVANVALNVLTNYMNKVAGVESDLPSIEPLAAAA